MSKKKDITKIGLRLVEIKGKDELFTSSLVVAEQTERSHKDVMALIRKFENDLKEIGFLTFQTLENRGTQGAKTEVALMDDYAVVLLLTHMRSIGVVADFKKRLVQEFKRMRKELTSQSRKETLQYKRDTALPMTDALTFVREMLGKKTKGVPHCSNEHCFVNRAVFGKYESIDERYIGEYDAKLLGKARERNTVLIGMFPKQEDRKALLDKFVQEYRAKNPKYDQIEDTKSVYMVN